MNVKIEYFKDTANIIIEGNIDTNSNSEIGTKFNEITDNKEIKNVNLDLKLLRSINSSGIGKILKFYKYIDEIGGEFKIIHASERVVTLFRDINLDKIISVSD